MPEIRKYHEINRETIIARTLALGEANPEAYRAQVARRGALKRDVQGDASPAILIAIYEIQQGLCAYCECELNGDYHVEHMTPLSQGGAHDWSNIALACPTCNLRKNAKTVEEFIEFLYRNELMGEEARLELRDRIRRLKRKLETAEETVDAIHSGLERMGE
jgi:hypothetical protein